MALKRWAAAGGAGCLAVCCLTACSGTATQGVHQSVRTAFVTINAAAPGGGPAIGTNQVTYQLPLAIMRPLHLPVLAPGEPCPTSAQTVVDTADFGGISLGTRGPIHPIIGQPGTRHGTATVAKRGTWFEVKTLWYSTARYQGPVLIRGQRLDGAGSVTFGEGPQQGFIADTGIPPGQDNGAARSWPGGTWVHSPGCYGFQVDGTSFSYPIVLAIRAASTGRS